MALSTKLLTEALQSVEGVDSCTISIQEGERAGQSINHLHVHIIPRSPGDKYSKDDQIYTALSKFDDQ